jgi:pyridoxal phosphate enzyme (YggS family)
LLIQVNIDDEASKSGVRHFDEALELANSIQTFPNLKLCGLMTIPSPQTDPMLQIQAFAKLRDWRDRLSVRLAFDLPHLSMGMSDDLEAAIAEGATIVRIGTAIFGARLMSWRNDNSANLITSDDDFLPQRQQDTGRAFSR